MRACRCLARDDETRRVLVDPVDDARPLHPPMPERRAPAVMQQRVAPACRPDCPPPGWTTRPAGLSTTIRCSSSNTIWSGISCAICMGRPGVRHGDRERRAGDCLCGRIPSGIAVGVADMAAGDQRLQPLARDCRQGMRKRAVKPPPGRLPGSRHRFNRLPRTHRLRDVVMVTRDFKVAGRGTEGALRARRAGARDLRPAARRARPHHRRSQPADNVSRPIPPRHFELDPTPGCSPRSRRLARAGPALLSVIIIPHPDGNASPIRGRCGYGRSIRRCHG